MINSRGEVTQGAGSKGGGGGGGLDPAGSARCTRNPHCHGSVTREGACVVSVSTSACSSRLP